MVDTSLSGPTSRNTVCYNSQHRSRFQVDPCLVSMVVNKLSFISNAIWWILVFKIYTLYPLKCVHVNFIYQRSSAKSLTQSALLLLTKLTDPDCTNVPSPRCHYKQTENSGLKHAYMMQSYHLVYFTSTFLWPLISVALFILLLY